MIQVPSKNKTFVWFAPVCWLSLCALAACGQVTSNEPDAGLPDASVLDAMVLPDAEAIPDATTDTPDAGPRPLRLITHSTSQIVQAGRSVACTNNEDMTQPLEHNANSYFRVFRLPDFDINGEFDISTVRVGIESAFSPSGTQPLEVRLHTLADRADLLLANLTPLESTEVMVEDQSTTLLDVPIEVTVPAGARLVVEIHTPDGVPDGNALFVGANNLGENAPSYILASKCNIPDPAPWDTIGASDHHMVLSVLGRERP